MQVTSRKDVFQNRWSSVAVCRRARKVNSPDARDLSQGFFAKHIVIVRGATSSLQGDSLDACDLSQGFVSKHMVLG